MCRHLAYLGVPVSPAEVLVEPPYGLYRQSWSPRMQRHGTVNADGFGLGWYAEGDPQPARYRRAVPIWADENLADLARVIRTPALLAAVRSATAGTAAGEAAAAPYTGDGWLFSHNGAVGGWPAAAGELAALLAPADLLTLEARCDSALVWALLRRRLRAGQEVGDALAATVGEIAAAVAEQRQVARLNLLVTDGHVIAATTWGDTLFHRLELGRSVLVASEPGDDGPGWTPVPDRSVLLATPEAVTVRPLTTAAPRVNTTGAPRVNTTAAPREDRIR
ncbi:ergothioneine biosynthesis protein EgtC [Kitasatospora sp. NBC_01287]|uniref:ergothioneine biosynthesis protein EgtC n=1 Tax=Kitasatospora sp. NBC_01287 TaxID=2903573 RepID=UPI0022547C2F|nr:ergothioneine biosynthesis protein EgtC [Kitasatospora sp. NBC_01287]MCX4745477.1 ergothioneine biosynthesis protein EgtC [Kitasatospora sp. NBC_01287]